MAKNHIKKLIKEKQKKEAEWYSIRSLLGYSWAAFLFMIGGREAGKSYATTDFFCGQWRKYKRPFYWLRLTEASQRKLLTNNAEKLVDPDLRRKYNLDLITKGDAVYEVVQRDRQGKVKETRLMARVMALSTFYNDKGSGLFDATFLNNPNMYYNICLDEMNREKNEKKSFDIVYAFTNQLENLVRSTKKKIRVICIGNTLEEASDILCAFNFLPERFGRFKLVKHKKELDIYLRELDKAHTPEEINRVNELYAHRDKKGYYGKRAVIEYIEPSDKYLTRRSGTIADILMPEASTFTNKIEVDYTLVNKRRLVKPLYIIKFFKSRESWFTVWDNNTICQYHYEQVRAIPMRPYLDELYDINSMSEVMMQFNSRCYYFKDLATFKMFQKQLELLKPRG